MAGVNYREHPVPEKLRRHFACVWRLVDPDPRPGVQTIYPDGRCELIALLGARSRLWDAVIGWHDQSATLFAAQRVTAVQLEASGPIDDVGIRLQPAASALLTRKLGPLRDRVVDLAGIDRATSRALLAAARAFADDRPEKLWRLLARLADGCEIDAKIESAVERIDASGGNMRIDTIARVTGMRVRTLQSRFLAHVGLAPKEFARLLRLQAMLRALGGNASLANLANDAGFSDQAHATREIKRVTGLTPARLRDELRRDRDGTTAIEIAAAFVRGGSR